MQRVLERGPRPGKSVWTFMGLSTLALGALGFMGTVEPSLSPTGQSIAYASQDDAHAGKSMLRQFSSAFSSVAQRVKPSVVSIHVERETSGGHGLFGMPFEAPQGAQPVLSGGTGIIVSEDGFILTNNHVVEQAKTIKVRLSDGEEYLGQIQGTDPKTDLAVIKIDADGLNPAHLGNSDAMQVGEWVVAIGHPYNLDFTVTAGIVSAVGRNDLTRKVQYQDFIQTDASINPGNSGGPLVNLDGEVIGINTLIDGRGAGLGFSIPTNMAKKVMDQLIDQGHVVRPWLGVRINSVNETMAKALDFDGQGGAFVVSVEGDSPADKGGIQAEDIITSIGNTPVHSASDLVNAVIEREVGEKVVVGIYRDGRDRKLKVITESLPQSPGQASARPKSDALSSTLGFELKALTPALIQELGLNTDEGVVIWQVTPGSPAFMAGLRQGDVILEAARKPVRSPEALLEAIEAAQQDEAILLKALRSDGTSYIALPLN